MGKAMIIYVYLLVAFACYLAWLQIWWFSATVFALSFVGFVILIGNHIKSGSNG